MSASSWLTHGMPWEKQPMQVVVLFSRNVHRILRCLPVKAPLVIHLRQSVRTQEELVTFETTTRPLPQLLRDCGFGRRGGRHGHDECDRAVNSIIFGTDVGGGRSRATQLLRVNRMPHNCVRAMGSSTVNIYLRASGSRGD